MRSIGSFLMLLLVALIALGYFVADSVHLRENIQSQQVEIDKLTASLHNAESEKQNALELLQVANQEKVAAQANLETVSQNLQTCRQQVDQTNQQVSQLIDENKLLNEQNRSSDVLASMSLADVSAQQSSQVFPTGAVSTLTLFVIGFASIAILRPKTLQTRLPANKHAKKAGSYVYLTTAEIDDLARRRRNQTQNNTRKSSVLPTN